MLMFSYNNELRTNILMFLDNCYKREEDNNDHIFCVCVINQSGLSISKIITKYIQKKSLFLPRNNYMRILQCTNSD